MTESAWPSRPCLERAEEEAGKAVGLPAEEGPLSRRPAIGACCSVGCASADQLVALWIQGAHWKGRGLEAEASGDALPQSCERRIALASGGGAEDRGPRLTERCVNLHGLE
eukprot:13673708-Alexandrium_andersonii.AAC.2